MHDTARFHPSLDPVHDGFCYLQDRHSVRAADEMNVAELAVVRMWEPSKKNAPAVE